MGIGVGTPSRVTDLLEAGQSTKKIDIQRLLT